MCFSPEADFAAAAVIGAIGVVTLRQVRTRRELIVGALPLLFATHQLIEAFVWLGKSGQVAPGVANAAQEAYVVFAYALLPIIVPIGFLLIEPSRRHRRWLRPFVTLGAALGALLLWHVTQYPIHTTVHPLSITYDTHTPNWVVIGVVYMVATCGAPLLSSRPYLQWFGVINAVGAASAAMLHQLAFASVWCLYASIASLLILEHFRRQRTIERRAARLAVA